MTKDIQEPEAAEDFQSPEIAELSEVDKDLLSEDPQSIKTQPIHLPPKRLNKFILGWAALAGILVPGLQRFYMRHKRWGWAYLGLGFIPLLIPNFWWLAIVIRIFCVAEGLWVLSMDNLDFDTRFNQDVSGLEWKSVEGRESHDPEQQLESMRRSGAITEAEYQTRRQQLRKGF